VLLSVAETIGYPYLQREDQSFRTCAESETNEFRNKLQKVHRTTYTSHSHYTECGKKNNPLKLFAVFLSNRSLLNVCVRV